LFEEVTATNFLLLREILINFVSLYAQTHFGEANFFTAKKFEQKKIAVKD